MGIVIEQLTVIDYGHCINEKRDVATTFGYSLPVNDFFSTSQPLVWLIARVLEQLTCFA
jgi:hypothetical protein